MKLDEALAAYRGGLSADIVQVKTDGRWGPIWTIPPCSPMAMERAGRQFTRSRAEAIRHVRRARLCRSSAMSAAVEVMIATELPSKMQSVTTFGGVVLQVDSFLEDPTLAALAEAFAPAPRP